MSTHSSILSWSFPWTEEPGRLQSMGSQELDTTEQLNHYQPTAPTPIFLPREAHGQKNPVGYSPWGCKELDMMEQLTTPTRRKLHGLAQVASVRKYH